MLDIARYLSAADACREAGKRRKAAALYRRVLTKQPRHAGALHSLGVRAVYGPCASGSLRAEMAPGDFVVPDQVVDRTAGRASSFHDGPDAAPGVAAVERITAAPDRAPRILNACWFMKLVFMLLPPAWVIGPRPSRSGFTRTRLLALQQQGHDDDATLNDASKPL